MHAFYYESNFVMVRFNYWSCLFSLADSFTNWAKNENNFRLFP